MAFASINIHTPSRPHLCCHGWWGSVWNGLNSTHRLSFWYDEMFLWSNVLLPHSPWFHHHMYTSPPVWNSFTHSPLFFILQHLIKTNSSVTLPLTLLGTASSSAAAWHPAHSLTWTPWWCTLNTLYSCTSSEVRRPCLSCFCKLHPRYTSQRAWHFSGNQ